MMNRILQAKYIYHKIAKYLSLSDRTTTIGFNDLKEKYYKNYWKTAAANISADISSIGYGFYRLQKGNRWTIVRYGEVMLDDHLSLEMAGNKALIHKLLHELDCHTVPIFDEFNIRNFHKARKFMSQARGYVVIKPVGGTGAGNGVTTKVNTLKKLKEATVLASTYNKNLIIEEEVKGHSYRLLYLNGEYIDAIRRDPPKVTGDGKLSLKELVNKENENRLCNDILKSLNPLTINLDCIYSLSANNLNPSYIPKKNDVVLIKTTVNENSRMENHVVKEDVHPSIIKLGAKIASLLDFQLIGLDLITTDIGIPLQQSNGVINEINTTPGLHHHDLVAEESIKVPVAEIILEYLFSQTNKRTYIMRNY